MICTYVFLYIYYSRETKAAMYLCMYVLYLRREYRAGKGGGGGKRPKRLELHKTSPVVFNRVLRPPRKQTRYVAPGVAVLLLRSPQHLFLVMRPHLPAGLYRGDDGKNSEVVGTWRRGGGNKEREEDEQKRLDRVG